MINKRFDLDRNYRNTAEILRAAQVFSARQEGKIDDVLAVPVDPEIAIRSGPEPWPIRLDDAASEIHCAAALIETWLRGGCCHVKFLWLERPAVRGFSGDTGRNFPCIESFEPMVANCLCGAAAEWN